MSGCTYGAALGGFLASTLTDLHHLANGRKDVGVPLLEAERKLPKVPGGETRVHPSTVGAIATFAELTPDRTTAGAGPIAGRDHFTDAESTGLAGPATFAPVIAPPAAAGSTTAAPMVAPNPAGANDDGNPHERCAAPR